MNVFIQNAASAPFLSVVEPNAEMSIVEANLANAVLAIDVCPSTAKPSIRDIHLGNISSANQPLRANRANQLRGRGERGDLQKCN